MTATARTIELPAPAKIATSSNPARVGSATPLRDLLLLAFVLGQLVLLAAVLTEVDMLPLAYRRVVYLAMAGSAVNYFLPLRFRVPFFTLLSITAIMLVLGTPTDPERFWDLRGATRGLTIVAVGALFIGACHLPIGFWARAAVLASLGVVVAIFRAGIVGTGYLAAVWPVIAGLFMFRLAVYLYDVSTGKVKASVWHRFAYFFMLPNVCAPFFPVVDFKTMVGSHYSAAPLVISQKGAHWIARGVLQLLAYRYIDQVFSMRIGDVDSGIDILRYVVTNSLVYLNVSGSFHLAIGLLLLFGFNLPETNHHYFLASSFSDYWRRVNIYWKDFMMKTFYYPAYFKLKRFGPTSALVCSVAWVFFLTWVLHLYQTWWLTGTVSMTLPDVLFWTILGVLVLANSLWEMKRGRSAAAKQSAWKRLLVLSAQTAATFACISLLWSLWSSPTVTAWVRMWAFADWRTAAGALTVLGVIAATKIAVELIQPASSSQVPAKGQASDRALVRRGLVYVWLPVAMIYLVAQPAVQAMVPEQYAMMDSRLSVQRIFDTLKSGDSFPPRRDGAEMNYYQRFARMDEGNRQLFEVLYGQVIPASAPGVFPIKNTSDLRLFELLPLFDGEAFETTVHTNAAGLRDREYALAKPNGTARIAVLGSSHVMGWGVRESEVFESVLESSLNRAPLPALRDAHVEIINFAVYGYSPLSQIPVLQQRVRPYAPDMVMLVGHPPDLRFANNSLRSSVRRGNPISDDFLKQTLKTARVYPQLHDGLAQQRLKPFEPALLAWSLAQIAQETRAMGAVPIYVFFPTPKELPLTSAAQSDSNLLKRMAGDAGFIVFDLSDVFDGQAVAELLTGVSEHSSPKAHALIAAALSTHLAGLSNTQWGPVVTRVARNRGANSTSLQQVGNDDK